MDQENASRKRFGLLISHLASDYALKRCQGVERAAKEANIDIVIFPGTLMQDFLGSNKDVSFTFTHNIIFEYAAKFQLDALIICIAGIADYYDQREFEAFLKRFSGIPVILMETRIPGYRSLVTDNRDGIRAVLEHLIGEHHYRKIGYVSGPDNNYDAQVRKQAYLETMDREDLENNLGVIAASGSYRFKQELPEDQKESDVIGQFGVGFYSAFMVADHISVITKKYGSDTAYLWQSSGADGYTITECERDAAGTDIIMPRIVLASVDFPVPDSPTRPRISPWRTSKVTSCSTS